MNTTNKRRERELLIIVNEDSFFLSHRKAIALAAKDEGWRVTVAARETGFGGRIRSLGLEFLPMPVVPAKVSVRGDMRTIHFLLRLYRDHPGAIVHHVGMKIIFLGTIAARMARVRGIVNAVAGLGSFFGGDSRGARWAWKILRLVSRDENCVTIFQNHDDEKDFAREGVRIGHKEYIKGSGVDLKSFSYTEEREDELMRVLYVGRMLRQKGVADLCKAAEKLRGEFEGRAEFLLCGDISSNANGLTEEELRGMVDDRYIRWLGYRKDISGLLSKSSVVVLPSYYREGLPKALIEASASGRPIVTCDSVGCRDTVTDGENGFLVYPRDPESLAARIRELLNDSEMRRSMGLASRRRAERDYDIRRVVAEHLRIWNRMAP